MEMQSTNTERKPNPRRRKRSKLQIFKESYLPVIIVAITVILLLVFIIGGIRKNRPDTPPEESTSSTSSTNSSSTEDTGAALEAEAQALLQQAAIFAADYDYAGAVAVLETFSGELAAHSELQIAHAQYTEMRDSMVEWSASQVVNLSFHVLIADPQRAFNDDVYGRSYRRNFITTTEFSAILQQLYDNGYMLVSLSDFYSTEFRADLGRDVYVENTLLLPEGRIPVMLTETNANYYSYMVDSNSDGKPDANGDGFAYNLCYGENGFYNELVLSDGTIVSGAYDMVPILEDFIAANPDFSFRGARAIIAITGYDGILGHRVHSKLTEAQRSEARIAAANVAQALRDHGYQIACFTYGNEDYNALSATEIQSDLQKWAERVAAIIGEVDILVYPKETDIIGEDNYTGNSKFNVMYNAGYRFFLGSGAVAWNQVNDLYIRHNRLMVTGSYLTGNPAWYEALFDASAVLDPYRASFN